MMEDLISDILKKHGIEDEKLAAALTEIFEIHTETVKDSIVTDYQNQSIIKGYTP
ncbi:hypothetical protein PZE06_22095 [Robertmurraya sp. DFI.2.37]|jgi:hypothetical protein|uniref:hypothetical protein n=1 Tax=Robertmurraya sp. DFI.2.37 TaxID=3031819 RepID=UPI0014824546|nr:hypothetical protein [Robertmurraya sp. DFI.2.37]MDF1510830.1 hypothetical protein [Robertmurraya sp. DFI.2.37]